MTSENERRAADRELVLARGVECHTTLPDGSVITGVIRDCSSGGVRIHAATATMCVGTNVDLMFVFPTGEKVRYRATVIHVSEALGFFGVQFDSDPIPVEVHRPTE